jgi:signal transduction histidine kinase
MVSGRSIVCDCPADLPPAVADPDALATVLDHVLDNAVKYSPDGGLIAVALSADSSGVQIEVSDSGIGMNEEGAAHCFDRFWQAESSDVRRFGGTGVGLYIVRSLVEGMGGEVGVRAMPGTGTTITTRLRRASPHDLANTGTRSAESANTNRTVVQEFMHQIGVSKGHLGS